VRILPWAFIATPPMALKSNLSSGPMGGRPAIHHLYDRPALNPRRFVRSPGWGCRGRNARARIETYVLDTTLISRARKSRNWSLCACAKSPKLRPARPQAPNIASPTLALSVILGRAGARSTNGVTTCALRYTKFHGTTRHNISKY
jgi:hypothetical protein